MTTYYQIHHYRFQYLIRIIDRLNLPSKSKVLDLGCYPLYLFRLLRHRGFNVFGVSSSHEKVVNPKINVLNLETDQLPYPSLSFKLVILSEVIEHLSTSPIKLFNEVYRTLLPGGYFLLTTPNVVRFQNLINLLLGKNIYFPLSQLSQNINHRHHREYTLTELLTYFNPNQYSIIKAQHFISYPPYRPKNRHDNPVLKLIKYLNFALMSVFPSRRDTILILAQKI